MRLKLRGHREHSNFKSIDGGGGTEAAFQEPCALIPKKPLRERLWLVSIASMVSSQNERLAVDK